jgi:hypothetical protein
MLEQLPSAYLLRQTVRTAYPTKRRHCFPPKKAYSTLFRWYFRTR